MRRLVGGLVGLVVLIAGVLLAPVPAGATTGAARAALGAAPAQPAVAARDHRPLPDDSGSGRRIVYSRPKQHVWIVGADGVVIRDFPVTGRSDWPRAGRYRVFSKSPWSHSTTYNVSYRYMVRFAHGRTAPIGFHTIPVGASGRPIQPESTLGQPLGLGGCVRSATPNARFLYHWAYIGTRVVVL